MASKGRQHNVLACSGWSLTWRFALLVFVSVGGLNVHQGGLVVLPRLPENLARAAPLPFIASDSADKQRHGRHGTMVW